MFCCSPQVLSEIRLTPRRVLIVNVHKSLCVYDMITLKLVLMNEILWEGADCIRLAQDRHRRWAAAKGLMNLRVKLGVMNNYDWLRK